MPPGLWKHEVRCDNERGDPRMPSESVCGANDQQRVTPLDTPVDEQTCRNGGEHAHDALCTHCDAHGPRVWRQRVQVLREEVSLPQAEGERHERGLRVDAKHVAAPRRPLEQQLLHVHRGIGAPRAGGELFAGRLRQDAHKESPRKRFPEHKEQPKN
eukprot:scaffold98546_cov65-Phaeocystis_antarctica.AAC.2